MEKILKKIDFLHFKPWIMEKMLKIKVFLHLLPRIMEKKLKKIDFLHFKHCIMEKSAENQGVSPSLAPDNGEIACDCIWNCSMLTRSGERLPNNTRKCSMLTQSGEKTVLRQISC